MIKKYHELKEDFDYEGTKLQRRLKGQGWKGI